MWGGGNGLKTSQSGTGSIKTSQSGPGSAIKTSQSGMQSIVSSQSSGSGRLLQLFNFHESNYSPTCFILITGERSSGVSTVFNLLFQQPTRPTSRINSNDEPIVANITNDIKIKGEQGIFNESEIDFDYDFFVDLFPNSFNQNINYKFIDSGNLSDNYSWYQKWTKFLAGVIFVIDKDRLQDEVSDKRELLVSILEDINEAEEATGSKIPLMILINKVEEIDDPILIQNREQFECSLQEYLDHKNYSICYKFVCMSSLNASLYRQFSLNGNFSDMSQHDIIRFCGMELGSEGKIRARDLSKHSSLIEELKQRILCQEGHFRWMNLTGLTSFLDWFEISIFPSNILYQYLSRQLSLLLSAVTDSIQLKSKSSTMKSSYSNYTSSSPSLLNSASSSDSQLPERYRDLLKLFVVTHNNYARVAYENASMDETSNIFLNEIRKLCRDDYEQNMTKIIELMILSSTRSSAPGASSETDRLSIILKMLSEHKSLDKYQLVANDLWENGKINVVMIVLERLWSDNVKKTFSFGASLDYSFTPSRSPGAGNSVSMTIEAINYVHSVSPEFITRVVEKLLTPLIDKLQITTCQIPLEAIFFKKSSKTDAIDLVSDSSRPSSPYDESNPHLLWEKGLNLALMRLEECAHHLLPSVSQIEPQIELLKAIIKKKISIKESLTGYTICLKEFLGKYPNFREQQYSLFCCLSHSAVPSCDIQWSAKLPESVNFDQDILNSPFLKSEIVLRDLLASTPHLSYMNNSRSLLTDFNNTAPLPIVKSEPDWNSRSNSPKLERMDSIKRKRGSSSASSNVEEVIPEPPEVFTLTPCSSPPRIVAPVKLTPSRRRLVIGGGEC